MRRIAIGGIVHETNTFAPTLTALSAFTIDSGPAMVERWSGTSSSMGGVLHGLREVGYEAVPLVYATAMPGGTVTDAAYRALLGDLIERLRAAAPVDGILLVLHGTMVAESCDDCEGEILNLTREIASPLVAVLDMHGSLTPAMVDAADALIAFNQNPHVDTFERGLEAVKLMQQFIEDDLRPARAFVQVPLLLNALTTGTARLPLRAMHEQAAAFRQHPGVVNISIMGGFAYSDVHDAGVSVLVTANDAALAQDMAQRLADIAWEHREAGSDTGLPVDEAVQRAVRARRHPVILADIGDNVGGGSPGDGTVLLRALIDAEAQDAVVVLADPQAVAQAAAAGPGARVSLLVGGKVDNWHGEPVAVSGVVENLTDGRFVTSGRDHFANIYGREVNMGRCARIRCGGITLLLTERKTPPGDLEQLRSQGIAPEAQRIIVVKSTIAFRGAYEPIAAEIIEVDTPGLCAPNLSGFRYHKLRRPIYPLDVFP
ncbi:MAG TPA: M81 family metallopeptidase [Spirillospora sp.]|nr:M81 family metallopeptidase [Spirillospora sp.]